MAPRWEEVEAQRNALLSHALARNSLDTYRTGINHYLRFCRHYRVPPLPLREHNLENFCVSLLTRVAHKSIKVYLCGVQFWSKMHGDRTIIADMHRLEYVMMAIRRVQGNTFTRPTRPPITWDMLQRICHYIATHEGEYDRAMLTSAVLLAFFGLLRVSEYTSPSANRADDATLFVSDVTFSVPRRLALIFLKRSKTDPFRRGVTVRIGMQGHSLCPVRALGLYIAIRGQHPGPLYQFQNGMYLTRARILDVITCSLPDVPFVNTHSFRRGGASALAAAGCPQEVIQILGRWKSMAYIEYLSYTDEYLSNAQRSMASDR